jgi:hypothetical protein
MRPSEKWNMNALNGSDPNNDAPLGLLLEELSKRVEAGEVIDLDAYCSAYPRYADELRDLVPVLERLAGLRQTGQDAVEGGGD